MCIHCSIAVRGSASNFCALSVGACTSACWFSLACGSGNMMPRCTPRTWGTGISLCQPIWIKYTKFEMPIKNSFFAKVEGRSGRMWVQANSLGMRSLKNLNIKRPQSETNSCIWTCRVIQAALNLSFLERRYVAPASVIFCHHASMSRNYSYLMVSLLCCPYSRYNVLSLWKQHTVHTCVFRYC